MGTLVDVSSAEGLIMLGRTSPLLGGMNVRLYAPFWELEKSSVNGREMIAGSARALAVRVPLMRRWSAHGVRLAWCPSLAMLGSRTVSAQFAFGSSEFQVGGWIEIYASVAE